MLAESVWVFTLLCLLFLMAIFVYVILHSGEEADYSDVQKRWYSFRSKWLVFLFGLGVIVTFATLLPFPISSQAGVNPNATIVNVVGQQWFWQIDKVEYSVGEAIEFHVTSNDVNHGFGIYNDKDHLLTQTQAMPGYVNKLTYVFEEPGTYKVLCMEFCGLVHHAMLAELTVK